MASAIKSALPSHLKPAGNKEEQDTSFERRHGKTRSHMVRHILFSIAPVISRHRPCPFPELPQCMFISSCRNIRTFGGVECHRKCLPDKRRKRLGARRPFRPIASRQ